MSGSVLRLLALYPTLLNIYADRGNILMLRKRCEWRGIGFEALSCGVGDPWPDEGFDMVYVGGGQDRDQAICAEDLAGEKAAGLRSWFAAGHPLLAVCGGYQLLGKRYETAAGMIEGAGAADLTTTAGDSRLIGPVAVQTGISFAGCDGVLAGFENHAGRTVLGPDAQPLGRVVSGHGNDGLSGLEGVISGHAIGTYLHGPLLPKNWWLADWLIAAAVGTDPERLGPLDDKAEHAAHRSALEAAGMGD